MKEQESINKEIEQILGENIKLVSESNRPLTLKEAKEKGYDTFVFENGDYKYRDTDEIEYLIRDGLEIASGLFVYSFDNGDYMYEDTDWIQHLIRDGVEIASGLFVYSFDNGDYRYEDKKGIEHLLRDGVEIARSEYVCNRGNYYEITKDEITFNIEKER